MIMIHISSLAANFHTASKNYHGPIFQATLGPIFLATLSTVQYLAKCVQKIPLEMETALRFTYFSLFTLFKLFKLP